MNPDSLRPIIASILAETGLPGWSDESSEACLAWLQEVGFLPSAGAWEDAIAAGRSQHGDTLDVFLTSTAEALSLGLDRETFEEALGEQMGEGERPDAWRLRACDGESFWFVDESVAPRLRLLQIVFNFDHLHVRREIPAVGALLQDGLRHLVATRVPQPGLPDCAEMPTFDPPALDEHAEALFAALAVIGMPCDLRDAARVAGIAARHAHWAYIQMLAAGLVERPGPKPSQGGQILTLAATGHTNLQADRALISQATARLEALGPLKSPKREG